MTDLWVYPRTPAPIGGDRDEGRTLFDFEPPHEGGYLRIVHSQGKPADCDPARDERRKEQHAHERAPNGTLYRGRQTAYRSPYRKSQIMD